MPSVEPFEYLVRIWQSQMSRHGKPMLAMIGEHSVHYWAILPTREKGLELLARHIGMYVIPDFQELAYFAELNSAAALFVYGLQSGKGDMLDESFRQSNPRSYEMFLEKHGRGPFTPPDSSVLEGPFRNS